MTDDPTTIGDVDPRLLALLHAGDEAGAVDYVAARAAREVGRPHLRAPSDVDAAHAQWKANCGPGALAAAVGVDVRRLRPAFPRFPEVRYTTLTAMREALAYCVEHGAARSFQSQRLPRRDGVLPTPRLGLAQVQWCGPWTDSAKANGRWAYLFTHWIALARAAAPTPGAHLRLWVYDVNAEPSMTTGDPHLSVLSCGGGGWVQSHDWSARVAPALVEDVRVKDRRAAGGWFVLNEVEVEVPC